MATAPNQIDQDLPTGLTVDEFVSPSAEGIDGTIKLEGDFSFSSVQHYLIVYLADRRIIHHKRLDDGAILTRIHGRGEIALDPPGLTIDVSDVLPPAPEYQADVTDTEPS